MFNPQQILENRYQLQHQYGRTAAGRQTWLANDQKTQEQVIIKLLAFSPQMPWEELKLFEREAQVLQSLNHPRIPHYRDYFSIDQNSGGGLPWFGLVQDYIPGSSLQDLLEKGYRFPEAKVKKIAKDILKILIYLHELSPPVLHRDIKPSNLILDSSEKIYLVDFGAVQSQASVTGVTFTVVGSSGYAPLEQFWGRAVAASDLYALGATLIHLLTNITPADLPQQDYRIKFANRVSLNPYFIRWIEQMTEISLEKRIQTAREALKSLQSKKMIIIKTENTAPQQALIPKLIRPFYSKINLHKTSETLEIYLPPKGFTKILFPHLFLLYFIGLLLSMSIPMFFNNLALFWVLSSIIGVLILLFIFFIIDEKTFVQFDHFQFKIFRKSRGIKYSLQSGSIGNIIGVFMEKKQSRYEVVIRSTSGTNSIGELFIAEECAWLTQEIQDWLYPR